VVVAVVAPLTLEDKQDLAYALAVKYLRMGDTVRYGYYARSYETYRWMREHETAQAVSEHRRALAETESLRRQQRKADGRKMRRSRVRPFDEFGALEAREAKAARRASLFVVGDGDGE